MKKVVITQITLLVIAIALGSILKGDLSSGVRLFHRLAGLAAGIAGLVLVYQAFTQNQSTTVKVLAVVTLLLTGSAGMGGLSTQSGGDYTTAFNQMTFSAIGALVVSAITLYLVKKSGAQPTA